MQHKNLHLSETRSIHTILLPDYCQSQQVKQQVQLQQVTTSNNKKVEIIQTVADNQSTGCMTWARRISHPHTSKY